MKKNILTTLLLTCICFFTSCTSTQQTLTATPTQTATLTAEPNAESSNSKLTVHFIDVKQGDALLQCEDEVMLIDSGNVADSSLIVAYLKIYNSFSCSSIKKLSQTNFY